ncbi:MAG: DNA primase [Candidatus Peribacteraceae bacterium]|jgi:DNA primase
MDVTQDIKARLTIEELVGQYCQLKKKGRNFVALCPFHKDAHPSLLVSPDKGIAYCFACQTGGDIFSFYQAIEGVDFRQALKDLGERTGVRVEEHAAPSLKKDEKERIRDVLREALQFYRDRLKATPAVQEYLRKRDVPAEQAEQFELGFAPDSFSATYEHLLKKGFSRKEILAAGLGIQKELKEERIYDRFRNRLMFPIHDAQGQVIAFGGRTLGEDDAKYVNSSEGVLYHKSSVLFGLHHAKEAMRAARSVILVEGYFDLLACHRVGVTNVVATSGTALTEQHVKVLKRTVDTVNLCLDADRAGQDAAERAFFLLSAEALNVRSILLPRKDASELLQEGQEKLKAALTEGGISYLDRVLRQLGAQNLSDAVIRREALRRLLSLLQALPFAVERKDYTAKAAAVFSTTESALEEDLQRTPRTAPAAAVSQQKDGLSFSKTELSLALLFLYPKLRATLLAELIAPEEPFTIAFYEALKQAESLSETSLDMLPLAPEHRERAALLLLFCEENGLAEWSESLAVREIRKNCISANRELLQRKQEDIARLLIAARAAQNVTEEALLQNQYMQIIRLRKTVG